MENYSANKKRIHEILRQLDRIRKYPECITQSQKNTHGMRSDKWILDQKLGIPKIKFTDHMKLKKKEDQNVGSLVLLRKQERNTHQRKYGDNV